MSLFPGAGTLEDLIEDNYGCCTPDMLAFYEPHRKVLERRADEFDGKTMSWRRHREHVWTGIPDWIKTLPIVDVTRQQPVTEVERIKTALESMRKPADATTQVPECLRCRQMLTAISQMTVLVPLYVCENVECNRRNVLVVDRKSRQERTQLRNQKL
jgi:hypothetical protein